MMMVEGYSICKVAMGYVLTQKNSEMYLTNCQGEVEIYKTQDAAFYEILKLI